MQIYESIAEPNWILILCQMSSVILAWEKWPRRKQKWEGMLKWVSFTKRENLCWNARLTKSLHQETRPTTFFYTHLVKTGSLSCPMKAGLIACAAFTLKHLIKRRIMGDSQFWTGNFVKLANYYQVDLILGNLS